MDRAVIYIHGKGGDAGEATHYVPLFNGREVIGLDYAAQLPWEAKEEFPALFQSISKRYHSVQVIANSIGAYFAMLTLSGQPIERAYFISPIVDMERLITDWMLLEHVTEEELKEKQEIPTSFGQVLSWQQLCYARAHPITWEVPTHIIYGGKDALTSYETISRFAKQTGATLAVMENGEHWFHTEAQMAFLDDEIRRLAR